jgi:hypothetical protein
LPSICSARCCAHSRRFCVGVQSCVLVDAAVTGSTSVAGGGTVLGAAALFAISMSDGLDCVLSGALKIRRPAMAPPMRFLIELRYPDGAV